MLILCSLCVGWVCYGDLALDVSMVRIAQFETLLCCICAIDQMYIPVTLSLHIVPTCNARTNSIVNMVWPIASQTQHGASV